MRRLLDVPCGDGNWIRTINHHVESYIGGDLVPLLIDELRCSARDHETFELIDLTEDALPSADAILCRDVFVHLSDSQVLSALENIKSAGIRYLIATTFPGRQNIAGLTGGWRAVDLATAPFRLGPPAILINEGCTEQDGAMADKSLGVWEIVAEGSGPR